MEFISSMSILNELDGHICSVLLRYDVFFFFLSFFLPNFYIEFFHLKKKELLNSCLHLMNFGVQKLIFCSSCASRKYLFLTVQSIRQSPKTFYIVLPFHMNSHKQSCLFIYFIFLDCVIYFFKYTT